ncbi:MAG TPA: hypothetical protein VJ508_17755, partial [Saprospiraceae bacterium]|nr:hypothetical protein [Saprospiraceae bacterium]
MNLKQFLTGLLITIIIQVLIFSGLRLWIYPLRQHTHFTWASILAMALFCIILFSIARVVTRSTQARLFIQLIMVAVFLKILLCLTLILIYKKVMAPPDNAFVWPFLLVYITSTIYEVI